MEPRSPRSKSVLRSVPYLIVCSCTSIVLVATESLELGDITPRGTSVERGRTYFRLPYAPKKMYPSPFAISRVLVRAASAGEIQQDLELGSHTRREIRSQPTLSVKVKGRQARPR